LYELRKRVFRIALSVFLFGALAYGIEHSIVAALIRPAGDQTFVYTSPLDGINFLFRLCLYAGIALSIPVIVYQFLRYLEPLFKKDSLRLIVWGSITSGVLALLGMAFGYFIGLPAALHFLLNQFLTDRIEPLLTIQAYMSFVTMYMLVSALLFQVPLFLIFINRIKPLQPKKLLSLKYERWIILGGFILGALMNPDPNLLHQIFIVGPLIVMYQVGVGIVWLANRSSHPSPRRAKLTRQDTEAQAARRRQAARLAELVPAGTPSVAVVPPSQLDARSAINKPLAKSVYISDFVVRRPGPTRQRLPHAEEGAA
jgi:sec-independent protein translocase protein TatC